MNGKTDCRWETWGKLMIGAAVGIVGLLLVVGGIIYFPIAGIVLAVPVFLLSLLFFTAKRSPECRKGNG